MQHLKKLPLLVAFTTGLVMNAVTANNKPAVLSENWSIKQQFTHPESAAFDADNRQIFISNVNHYAKDGNGFISRVSDQGELLELKWLDGINSPTGLTVADGKLYAVDYDELLLVDIASATIQQRIPAPHANPGLNDVVVSEQHGVFVTGSASNTIYRLEEDKLRVWLQDDEILKQANGLFIVDNKLLYGGQSWRVFDIESKTQQDASLKLPEAFKDIDGITDDGCGGYLVTLIDDKRIWRIGSNGKVAPFSEQAIDGIDLQRYQDQLYVPRVGGSLSRYQLNSQRCDGF